uniref:Forkhead box protein N4-like n=1 Tax=Phallusia mammillata TaxID=59560 RepID=A0A6F9DDP4_9ASCI|nr:forkhead box protein N4-like [Phallusia mammillata]
MSLQKSKTGCLPVSDIYSFMMENFPYFKTAPDGWKNSVRHNLSLNKCFEKVEKPNGTQRKGCLWALNPAKASKMEEEVQKWKRKDPEAIRRSMSHPDDFDREMEELRRADEEAARRRMLSLSSHGLSMVTPPHNFHPGFPLHRPTGRDAGQGRPHMHPSGSVSMPTTPQHLSPQTGTYRHPMTPVQRTLSTNANTYGHVGNHNFTRPPRQLFQFPTEPHSLSIGVPEVTSTPVGKSANNLAKTLPQLSSPNSSSSTSSGTCAAFFGSIADTLSAAGPDLNDLDLDSSLADLSALQVPFWDETTGVGTPQDGASDPLLSSDVFEETDGHQTGPQGDAMAQSFHIMGQSAHRGGDPPGPDVFPSRFGGDLSYLASTGNNKPVMLH